MKSGIGTSLPEQTLFFYVRKFFPDAISRFRLPAGRGSIEADIFIPSLKVAVEYDGSYYHKRKIEKDEYKNEIFNSNSIFVIRLRERGLPQLKSFYGDVINVTSSPIDSKNIEYVEQTIHRILQFCGKDHPINPHIDYEMFLSDAPQIYSLIYCNEAFPSISDLCGLEYWEYERNYPLVPENIPKNDWAHAFLKCPNGKEFLLPRYFRQYKGDCQSDGVDCTDCLYNIYCPFLYACKRTDTNMPVKCKYVEEKVMQDAMCGKTYMRKQGVASFTSWLFNESDCGMNIIRLFLDSPPESICRENILRFFCLIKQPNERYITCTAFPAWTLEDIELLKRFREQVSDVKISIQDRTEDKPGQRRTKPYIYL